MDRKIFGTDGIRGPAYSYPLDEAGARQIGKAIAAYFAKSGDHILIGRDPRESSPMLESAVADGITSMGIEVQLLGVVPTAGLAFLTNKKHACAGVMITASHNPYTDNGIKVFSAEGSKLPDGVENEINDLIASDIKEQAENKGQITNAEELIHDYIDFLVLSVGTTNFADFNLAIDCANGATSYAAKELFTRLQAKVTMLFDQPNGTNINDHCGATDTNALQDTVKSQKLDVGIAFDGDGDRLIVIDDQGRALSGDHILYILAVCRKEPGVVATLMSNIGLEKGLQEHGIALKRTSVGDRYVLEGLLQTGYQLGGEQSGHVIMRNFYTTGDGLLTAIQLLKYIEDGDKSLTQWFDELTIWPQALVNVPMEDKTLLNNKNIQKFIAEQTAQIASEGRLNIRPSGTEPLLRVMVEASGAQQKAESIAAQLSSIMATVKD